MAQWGLPIAPFALLAANNFCLPSMMLMVALAYH